MELALACEQFRDGLLGQPASAATSLAFLAAGLAVLAGHRVPVAGRVSYGLLVATVGVGSWVQHGPHPAWQAYAHDLPLAAVLAYLAVDAAADLTGRRLPAGWWVWPSVAVVPAVALGPAASTAAQAGLGVAAVALGLARARWRPPVRRTVLAALAVLAAGALAGTLADRAGLCQPESLWQGHAVWHLLAAGALWWLAPVVGSRPGNRSPLTPGGVGERLAT